VTWTRAQADARNAPDWTDADVRATLGYAHIRAWKRVLDANRYLRTNVVSVAQGSDGRLPIASFDAGAGDSQQRFYRLLYLHNGLRVYDEDQRNKIPLGTITGVLSVRPLWYRDGDYLQCLPQEPAFVMTAVVNHTPTPMDQLSQDTVAAEFPRDYELILCYEAAALLLSKGGRETAAAADLQQGLADKMWSDCLGDLARTSTDPTVMEFPDIRGQWGAEGW
jgi:hypothetical protein